MVVVVEEVVVDVGASVDGVVWIDDDGSAKRVEVPLQAPAKPMLRATTIPMIGATLSSRSFVRPIRSRFCLRYTQTRMAR